MKEKWQDWIVNGEAEFTEKGNRKRASYQLVAEWADNTWKKVATDELIIKGFRQCGYTEYDGETLHSRLQETIKKREVPEEREVPGNSRNKRISGRNDGFAT